MKGKKVIFILGHGRSGTTLLNKALSAHPDICFMNYEFNDLPFFYQNQCWYDKYGDKKYQVMAQDFFAHPWIDDPLQDIDGKDFGEFMRNVFDYYRSKEKKDIVGVKVVGDIQEHVAMIRDVFPGAYCIHLIRDPRDVFLSLKKLWFGAVSPFYFGKSWVQVINTIRSLQGKIRHYHEIRYEDLITKPEQELRSLSSFLGVAFSRKMLSYHKDVGKVARIHPLLDKGFVSKNFNKWKKELGRRELGLIYAGAGKKIFELGYSDKEYKNRIRFATRLKEYISDKTAHYRTLLYFRLLKFRRFSRPLYRTKIKVRRKLGLA